MGVIIGATTTVQFGTDPATQVSWGVSPNVQRAYVLGQWGPYTEGQINSPSETLNITTYSTQLPFPIEPTEECVNANTKTASVSPAGCGGGSDGPTSTAWYVTSYGYSKGDARGPGTESWSLMQYVTMGIEGVVLPTYNLRGISEGSITSSDTYGDAEPKVGITFVGSVDEGTQGSVSAGQIGRSDFQYTGVISSVGNSNAGAGDICSASCSMPYTALYI